MTAREALSNIGAMEIELAQLENQLEQLIGRYGRLKAEHSGLHVRVAQLEADNRKLSAKLTLAAQRLEAVLEKLPEA